MMHSPTTSGVAGASGVGGDEVIAQPDHQRSALQSTRRVWPLDRSAGTALVVAYAAIFAVLLCVGMLIVHALDHSALQRVDVRIAHWFDARRTSGRNDAAQIGAGLADAYTLTPAVIILVIAFAIVWRRWHDSVMLATALLLEKALFLPVSLLVDRPRPPVVQLDGNPPTSSYPSGHVAAAVAAYVSLAIIVGWHTRNRVVRAVFFTLAVTAPIVVAVARLHLGMHHLSDVVIGGAAGLVCVLVTLHILRSSVSRLALTRRSTLPSCVLALDVSDLRDDDLGRTR